MAKGEPVGVMVISSRKGLQFSDDYLDFLLSVGNQIGVAVHNAELHENIKKAYQRLQDAQEQIIRSEKMVSLGKMSASIAHEINNPLSSVLTYVRLLMRLNEEGKISCERDRDIKKYLNIMESELSRCGDIVKNLLSFSRQSRAEIKDHHVEELIKRSLSIIEHELQLKGIKLKMEIQEDIPPVKCDIRQMQQAVLNLLINANEAMPEGGILTIRADRSAKDGYVELQVEDTGCGIPQENLDKIFEPFFTTKEDGKGVGLGLSVAYAIIMRHRGTIDVQSIPGKGTRFIVNLPLTG
jgi:two-component system NtrC family sensor kinase